MIAKYFTPTPYDVIIMFDLLDRLDSFQIEEAKGLDYVDLNSIKSVNRGNNCLHYVFMLNNHRLVVQTYKDMNHTKLDIIQGQVDSEEVFTDLVEFINYNKRDWLTDKILNEIFVLYHWYLAYCGKAEFTEMDDFMIEISESVTLYWDSSNHRWVFMAEGAPMQDIKNALYFTEQIGFICGQCY